MNLLNNSIVLYIRKENKIVSKIKKHNLEYSSENLSSHHLMIFFKDPAQQPLSIGIKPFVV